MARSLQKGAIKILFWPFLFNRHVYLLNVINNIQKRFFVTPIKPVLVLTLNTKLTFILLVGVTFEVGVILVNFCTGKFNPKIHLCESDMRAKKS